ncbi:radical SAM protein [Marinilabiliaceae bacterium JC017]|nr:radical SAM protein [Marinilabiliaceae bacterium JC017]
MKMSQNIPFTFPGMIVWELTEQCNFKCLHCYNLGQNSGRIEFDKEKALDICDQLIDLKVRYVLLSGGEVLMCDFWEEIARKLEDGGVRTGIISNGWLVDKAMIDRIKATGVDWVCFSLDGAEAVHDKVRQKGSFQRIMNALDLLADEDVYTSISTAMNKLNIQDMEQMYQVLCAKKANAWQLQLAVPEGASKINENELILDPSQIDTIIDFVYDRFRESPVRLYLGDCVGYYNVKEIEVRSSGKAEEMGLMNFVDGCQAGIGTAGIKANGDFTGCISLSHPFYVAGSVYERTLLDMWNDPKSFAWNRYFDKDQLKGDCKECVYGEYCLSGCPGFKYDDDFNVVENKHCSYNYAIKQERLKNAGISS